jgi:hypothetical protein
VQPSGKDIGEHLVGAARQWCREPLVVRRLVE